MDNNMLKYGRQAIIDKEKLYNNIKKIKTTVGEATKIIAVVKGGAYGHGLEKMAEILSNNENISMLAVSSLEEAYAISKNKCDVLVLYPVMQNAVEEYILKGILPQNIIFSINDMHEFNCFKSLAIKYNIKLRLHIRCDFESGVRGFDTTEIKNMPDMMSDDSVDVCGIYGHIYSSYSGDKDESVKYLNVYSDVFKMYKDIYKDRLMVHMLTSVSYELYPEYHFDAVRLGAVIYGLPIYANDKSIQPTECIMSICASIMKIIDIDNKVRADYNGELESNVKRVGLLPIGNWDIPNFFNGENTTLYVNGKVTHIAGSPCMDTCLIDLTNLPDIHVGDMAYILANKDKINVFDKMIENGYNIDNCQMLYAGNERLPKIYI